jgi:hypothetical protein
MHIATVKRSLSMAGLALRKYAPEILVGTGLLAGVGATIFACKATLKAQKIVAELKEEVGQIEGESASITSAADNSNMKIHAFSKEQQQAITQIYSKKIVQLLRVYGPAILLTGASIGCILSAFKILKTRNAALVCALAAVESAYDKYRQAVAEEHGMEGDLKFLERAKKLADGQLREIALENDDILTDEIDRKRGLHSPYGKWFDKGNRNWDPNRTYNYRWLEAIQANMNDILRGDGYLMLNDVYYRLGLPKTSEGQYVGWVYKRNGQNDGFVDFGLDSRLKLAEFNGRDPADYYLDFNVDGIVSDFINCIVREKTYE